MFLFHAPRRGQQRLLTNGFPTSLKISNCSIEEKKSPKPQAILFIDCVLPSEVVPLPDHKQDLCVFSFHSSWVILIETSAAVPIGSERGALGMFWFRDPYSIFPSVHSPLYQFSAVNGLPQVTWCLRFVLQALSIARLALCLNNSQLRK